jgi:soluble lytic murein transglycosylase-like protein
MLAARRHVRGGMAATLAVAVALGMAAPAAGDPDLGEELEETQEELDSARGALTAADQRLNEALTRLNRIDEQLAALTAELNRLQAMLTAAQEELEHAQERTLEATRKLEAVSAELEALVEEELEHRRRLNDRAAKTYMRGAAQGGAVLATFLGVSNLHDLAVGMRAVDNILSDDKHLIDRTRELVDETRERRAEAARLRDVLADEQAAARRARDEVRSLVQRQEQLVAEMEAERAERARILASIEADREQQRALVRRLENAVASIQREIFQRQWQDLAFDGSMPEWASRIPAHGRQWAPAIHQAAAQRGIDPRLFAALVWSESNFQPDAVSRAGAIGLAQLMPTTAAMLRVDPWHPLQNLDGGSRYLAMQFATFGSVELALAAYNAGPNAVRRHGGIPPFTETQVYVVVVLSRYAHIAGS